MRRKRVLLRSMLVSVALVSALGCASQATRLRQQLALIPAKSLSNFNFDGDLPIAERVGLPPQCLMDYLLEADRGSACTPYILSQEERDAVKENLSWLPAGYRRLLSERLIGIYFIENWAGSGMADYVLDAKEAIYAILIINPEVLRHDLTEWMTYREMSCFRPGTASEEGIRVRVDCGRKYTGLTYVLFHETSHIVDYVKHCTPYVEDNLRVLGLGVKSTAFTSPVWKQYAVPFAENDFAGRSELSFYGKGNTQNIGLADAASMYANLSKTCFCSLYGSRNWAEDFAEYMTWYLLTKQLHQPYALQVLRGDRIEHSYSPMESALVLTRAEAIRGILQ